MSYPDSMTTSMFMYKGHVESVSDLPDPEGSELEVWSVRDEIYASVGGKWDLIADVSESSQCYKYPERVRKIVRTKCESCGAPLRAIFEFEDACKCGYCGTVNVVAEWTEAKDF